MKKIKIYSNKRNVKHLKRIFLALEVGKKKRIRRWKRKKKRRRWTKRKKAETKQKEAEIVVWVELKKVLGWSKNVWAEKEVFWAEKERATHQKKRKKGLEQNSSRENRNRKRKRCGAERKKEKGWNSKMVLNREG